MEALFNTTFFFSPAIEGEVRRRLAERWVPSCAASGSSALVCLAMDSDDGICRLAIQTCFPSVEEAGRFADEVAGAMAAELTAQFGPEAFTAFSTIMEKTVLP